MFETHLGRIANDVKTNRTVLS